MSMRQPSLELFRIFALINAHQHHLIQARGFFSGVLYTLHWE
jgi:hypothetical protein